MSKEARALARSTEHFKDILHGIREDLLKAKISAEEDFVKSLEGGRETKNHIGDSDPPDYVSQTKIIDLGHRIHKIDAAIGRLDRGTFGKCLKYEECEGTGEIEPELLAIEPTRIYCGTCQEEQEEKDKARKRMLRGRGVNRKRR